MKSWSNIQNFTTYRKSGTEKSNLRSNFTPEVVLSPFLRMRTKSGQNGSKPAKTQVMYETGHGELNFVQYECQKDNSGRFCTGAIAKLDKKQPKQTMRRRGPFAKNSCRKANKSCTILLIKWLINVRRNDFVGNNSLMSIDRPKPANSNTRKRVYAKVL